MRSKVKLIIFVIIAGLTLTQEYGIAAGGGWSTGGSSASATSSFAKGEKAVKAGDYKSAVRYLKKAAKSDPNNADVQNLLGYSYRKLGKTDKAFKHYNLALNLDPRHRGANEYLGELYLETDQLDKAEERLEVLDKVCAGGCEEYDDLKEAIEKYKATNR